MHKNLAGPRKSPQRELSSGSKQSPGPASITSFLENTEAITTSADPSHHVCKNNRKIPDLEPRRWIHNLLPHYTRAGQPLAAGLGATEGIVKASLPQLERACDPKEGGLGQSLHWYQRKKSLQGATRAGEDSRCCCSSASLHL